MQCNVRKGWVGVGGRWCIQRKRSEQRYANCHQYDRKSISIRRLENTPRCTCCYSSFLLLTQWQSLKKKSLKKATLLLFIFTLDEISPSIIELRLYFLSLCYSRVIIKCENVMKWQSFRLRENCGESFEDHRKIILPTLSCWDWKWMQRVRERILREREERGFSFLEGEGAKTDGPLLLYVLLGLCKKSWWGVSFETGFPVQSPRCILLDFRCWKCLMQKDSSVRPSVHADVK